MHRPGRKIAFITAFLSVVVLGAYINTHAQEATTTETVSTSTSDVSSSTASTTPDTASTTLVADNSTSTIQNQNQSSTTGDITASSSDAVSSTTPEVPAVLSAPVPASDTPSSGGEAAINTGNALAFSNIVNVINTNAINSDGLLAIWNLFGPILNGLTLDSFSATSSCPADACVSGGLDSFSVNNNNSADIQNNSETGAGTGQNSVNVGNSDIARIMTGNAAAAGNVVNVANSNFVDSNYLLFVVNSFGPLNGDLVLPGLDFFSGLRNVNSTSSGTSDISGALASSSAAMADADGTQVNGTVNNSSTADIQNGLDVNAGSGDNEITSSTASGTISTGEANSVGNTVNVVNSNHINSTPIFILVRFFGKWNGSMLNTPPGLQWQQTQNGLLLYNAPDVAAWGTEASGTSEVNRDTAPATVDANVNNSNNAHISNSVKVFALTGDNKINGGSSSTIRTGNAMAVGNIVNIVNTNVVGRNFLLAIINIFGDWAGNLSFGHPDMWIGQSADLAENPLRAGDKATVHVAVENKGDAPATNVAVNSTLSDNLLSITDPKDGTLQSSSSIGWTIAQMAPHESKTFDFVVQASAPLPRGNSAVTVQGSVTEKETDANAVDNQDSMTLALFSPPVSGGGEKLGENNGAGYLPNVVMTKTSDAKEHVKAGDTVKYTITLENKARGAVFDASLVDVLRDPSGQVINKQTWPVDILHPFEKVTVTYDVAFADQAPAGAYLNDAQLVGKDYFQSALLVEATSTLELESSGKVLGASTTCGFYLGSYIRLGARNNEAEVKKLQVFLNRSENANLPVTGFYGRMTYGAVRNFQRKYSEHILKPWGGKNPAQAATGYVYKTTQRWINMMNCSSLNLPMPVLK